MRPFLSFAVVMISSSVVLVADSKPLYQQDFSKVEPGPVPEEIMVLDGQFAVREDAGNRFLELPGAPLESFGVLFGPSEASDVQVTAKIMGTRQGRKYPMFSAGLNGVGGFKVRVAPAKQVIELTKGDDVKGSTPFSWKSGEWTNLKLRVTKSGTGVKVQAKAWHGTSEPVDWQLTLDEPEPAFAGRASVWGMPFSGSAIRFDDLKVEAAAK